jgi:quercetin dioxygenase-like cupin family protein
MSLALRTVVAFFLIGSALSAQAPTQAVEITAEPLHHLELENQYVRLFRVEVPPRGSTLLHRHRHDYVFVTVGASEVSNAVEGKAPVSLKLTDGEARMVEGGFAHVASNLASTPFRNITVEILPAAKRRALARRNMKPAWERGLEVLDRATIHTLFVKDGLRATDVELPPGGELPLHTHSGPHLAVAVTDLEVTLETKGKPARVVRKKAGEYDWIPGGITHTVKNTGKAGIRFVTIEFR